LPNQPKNKRTGGQFELLLPFCCYCYCFCICICVCCLYCCWSPTLWLFSFPVCVLCVWVFFSCLALTLAAGVWHCVKGIAVDAQRENYGNLMLLNKKNFTNIVFNRNYI